MKKGCPGGYTAGHPYRTLQFKQLCVELHHQPTCMGHFWPAWRDFTFRISVGNIEILYIVFSLIDDVFEISLKGLMVMPAGPGHIDGLFADLHALRYFD